MVTDGLAVLCQADAAGLDAGTMAELLLVLEQADTMAAAARASILGAFTSALGYQGDGHAGPVPWLMDQTQTTRGRASAQVSRGKKLRAHPQVAAAMAAGQIMGSWADKVMKWTDRLPADSRETADEILLGAVAGGVRLEDLAALACTMYEQSKAGQPDDDGPADPDLLDPEAAAFADRSVKIEATLDGAGTLYGDLSAECTGLLATVLDALSGQAGDVDDRTRAQRYHDGLAEACRRLIAAGLIPQRAGQPTKAVVHIPFGQLRRMDGGSVYEQEWRAWAAGEWAARRGAATILGHDGSVWLDGAAAEAAGCDAMMIPVVFGSIDWQALDRLVDQCVELHGIRHGTGATTRRAARTRGCRCCGTPSWAPSWTSYPAPAAPHRYCGPGYLAAPSSDPPARSSTSGTARTSPPRSAVLSPSGTSTARSGNAIPCPSSARSTTSCTRRTADPPRSGTVFFFAGTTTRSSSTAKAGQSGSSPTGPPRQPARSGRSSAATDPPPGPAEEAAPPRRHNRTAPGDHAAPERDHGEAAWCCLALWGRSPCRVVVMSGTAGARRRAR